MRVEYELRFLDYFCFTAIHQYLLVTLQLAYLAPGALLVLQAWPDQDIMGTLGVGAFVYCASWLLQFTVNVFVLYSKKNKSLLTRHTVEIQADAFFEENPFSKSYHYWPGIAKVVARPGFIAVYINAHAAHIIPNRAFTHSTHRSDFLALLKQRLLVDAPDRT